MLANSSSSASPPGSRGGRPRTRSRPRRWGRAAPGRCTAGAPAGARPGPGGARPAPEARAGGSGRARAARDGCDTLESLVTLPASPALVELGELLARVEPEFGWPARASSHLRGQPRGVLERGRGLGRACSRWIAASRVRRSTRAARSSSASAWSESELGRRAARRSSRPAAAARRCGPRPRAPRLWPGPRPTTAGASSMARSAYSSASSMLGRGPTCSAASGPGSSRTILGQARGRRAGAFEQQLEPLLVAGLAQEQALEAAQRELRIVGRRGSERDLELAQIEDRRRAVRDQDQAHAHALERLALELGDPGTALALGQLAALASGHGRGLAGLAVFDHLGGFVVQHARVDPGRAARVRVFEGLGQARRVAGRVDDLAPVLRARG